jgi:hypothetical protein
MNRSTPRVRRTARVLALATGLAAASLAVAQSQTPPPVQYRSAFEGYRPWGAPQPANWRAVNDEVLRLGGHAGHLRSVPGDARAATREAAPSAPPPAARDPQAVEKKR